MEMKISLVPRQIAVASSHKKPKSSEEYRKRLLSTNPAEFEVEHRGKLDLILKNPRVVLVMEG